MTFSQLSLLQCLAAVALLGAGVALMLIAPRRRWRPSLLTALAVAALLRVAVLALCHRIQPYDLANDFWDSGVATLHHHDPILNNRPNGWASLPTYTFVLAAAVWATVHFHWTWVVVARIPALLADLGVVAVVGAVVRASGGSGDQAALRRFQYACNPVAILISSVHGQLEPACLLITLSALVVVMRGGPGISARRAVAGGLLLALAISCQTWPVLFGPALLLALPSWRRRLQAVAGAAVAGVVLFATMPFTVGTPLDAMPYLFRHIMSNQPTIGTWGWSGLWVTQHPTAQPVWSDPLWLNVAHIGTKVALAAALVAVFWWRRGHPLDMATATTTALIAVTPAFGNQYLLWPVPPALARPTRLTMPLQLVLACYAAVFYLPMDMMYGRVWQDTDNVMMFASLGVVAFMVAALPWRRRVWDRSAPPAETPDELAVLGPLVAEVTPT